MIDKVLDYWYYYILGLYKFEKLLNKYQGYGTRTILKFKRKNNLDWRLIKVLLSSLIIIDGLELRQQLRKIISDYNSLFIDNNTYITHFGPVEKSGSIILNQFLHCAPDLSNKIIDSSKIHTLPDDSNIIFLDDFIGTGSQALDFIYPITYVLNDSIKPYLFTICATNSGLFKIQSTRTKFCVHASYILNDRDYLLLDSSCKKLDIKLKDKLKTLNSYIMNSWEEKFNLNIPFAFYYSIPDNALPILWKDNYNYFAEGSRKEWYGLIPRNY